ncbi:MAG: hypothetical protein ACLQVK_02890 [Acidimicrobiales bacterium]
MKKRTVIDLSDPNLKFPDVEIKELDEIEREVKEKMQLKREKRKQVKYTKKIIEK